VKSAAGDRILGLPPWAVEMLANRWVPGTAPDAPIFPDTNGGFRDPHNAQKAIRNARRPIGWRRRNPEAAKHLEDALRHLHDRDRTDP
jgi:hypothetical protein